jgi:hypothetical protein
MDVPTDKQSPMKDSPIEHSVGDFVGKLITNGMIVQIPTENFIDKSKDCGSDTSNKKEMFLSRK